LAIRKSRKILDFWCLLDLPALPADNVGMQYTIRNVPKRVDEALRRKAKEEGRSLNELVIEAIEQRLKLPEEKKVYHDLDWFIGAGELEPEVLEALEEQRRITPEELREFWGIDPETGKRIE
jgi:hypothetical protein